MANVWCWKFNSSSAAAISYVPSQWVPQTVCVTVLNVKTCRLTLPPLRSLPWVKTTLE